MVNKGEQEKRDSISAAEKRGCQRVRCEELDQSANSSRASLAVGGSRTRGRIGSTFKKQKSIDHKLARKARLKRKNSAEGAVRAGDDTNDRSASRKGGKKEFMGPVHSVRGRKKSRIVFKQKRAR